MPRLRAALPIGALGRKRVGAAERLVSLGWAAWAWLVGRRRRDRSAPDSAGTRGEDGAGLGLARVASRRPRAGCDVASGTRPATLVPLTEALPCRWCPGRLAAACPTASASADGGEEEARRSCGRACRSVAPSAACRSAVRGSGAPGGDALPCRLSDAAGGPETDAGCRWRAAAARAPAPHGLASGPRDASRAVATEGNWAARASAGVGPCCWRGAVGAVACWASPRSTAAACCAAALRRMRASRERRRSAPAASPGRGRAAAALGGRRLSGAGTRCDTAREPIAGAASLRWCDVPARRRRVDTVALRPAVLATARVVRGSRPSLSRDDGLVGSTARGFRARCRRIWRRTSWSVTGVADSADSAGWAPRRHEAGERAWEGVGPGWRNRSPVAAGGLTDGQAPLCRGPEAGRRRERGAAVPPGPPGCRARRCTGLARGTRRAAEPGGRLCRSARAAGRTEAGAGAPRSFNNRADAPRAGATRREERLVRSRPGTRKTLTSEPRRVVAGETSVPRVAIAGIGAPRERVRRRRAPARLDRLAVP